jgi:hypothetical protein
MEDSYRAVRIDRQNYDIRLHEPLWRTKRERYRRRVRGNWLELSPHFFDLGRRRNWTNSRRPSQRYVRRFISRQLCIELLVDRANTVGDFSRQFREDEDAV